jgi:hypothetical protein
MIFSLFGDHSLKVPTKARLVDDGDSEALRRKLESVEWKPANGFLRDHCQTLTAPSSATLTRYAFSASVRAT